MHIHGRMTQLGSMDWDGTHILSCSEVYLQDLVLVVPRQRDLAPSIFLSDVPARWRNYGLRRSMRLST